MDAFDPETIYFASRIRAMKSQLFTPARMDDLLDANDLQMVIEVLLNSPYASQLSESLSRFHGAEAVEDAVTRHFVATLQKLRLAARGELKAYTECYLLQWDLMAVKSLLRCRHHGLDSEDTMEALVPGPTLTVPRLKDFANRDTMESLVQALAGWSPELCGCLVKRLDAYTQHNALGAFQEALDQAYYVFHVRSLRDDPHEAAQYLRLALQMEIDRINLRTLFRLSESELDPEARAARMLPGGTLSGMLLRRFAEAPSVADAVELLGPTMYRDIVERLFEYISGRRFAPLERMIDLFMLRRFHRMAAERPVSFATFLHYTWTKHNEVINLRLITRGQARQLPRGRLREELVYELAVGARH